MASNNIPGYYYDESKQKYFKIIPNHLATLGSPHSQAAVQKAAQAQIARKRLDLFEAKELEQRTQKSRILRHPLLGHAGLARESSSSVNVSLANTHSWAQGLERTKCMESMHIGRTWTESCALFAYDKATGIFVVGSSIERDVAATWLVLAYPTLASQFS